MDRLLLPEKWQTARTEFIQPTLELLPEIYSITKNQKVMQYITTGARTEAETKAEVEDWQRQWQRQGFGPYFALDKNTKKVMGFAKLYTSNRCPYIQFGYILDEVFWGKGLGTELAKTLLDLNFEYLQVPYIAAFARFENSASRHILTKLGMRCQSDAFISDNRRYCYYLLSREEYLANLEIVVINDYKAS